MAALEMHESTPVTHDLIAESNHRIANHLTLLASMVQMQDLKVAKGPEILTRTQVREILRETAGKIVGVGTLHRKLAHEGETAQIDLGAYIIEHAKELTAMLSVTRPISIVERIERQCFVTAEQAHCLMLIVGEIMMNTMKHAHPAGLPISLSITCSRDNLGAVTLEVADDGVGLPEDFDPSQEGLGFRIIRTLAKRIGADLAIASDSLGLIFRLSLPANADISN